MKENFQEEVMSVIKQVQKGAQRAVMFPDHGFAIIDAEAFHDYLLWHKKSSALGEAFRRNFKKVNKIREIIEEEE